MPLRIHAEHNNKIRRVFRDVTWRGRVGKWRLIRDWSYLLPFQSPCHSKRMDRKTVQSGDPFIWSLISSVSMTIRVPYMTNRVSYAQRFVDHIVSRYIPFPSRWDSKWSSALKYKTRSKLESGNYCFMSLLEFSNGKRPKTIVSRFPIWISCMTICVSYMTICQIWRFMYRILRFVAYMTIRVPNMTIHASYMTICVSYMTTRVSYVSICVSYTRLTTRSFVSLFENVFKYTGSHHAPTCAPSRTQLNTSIFQSSSRTDIHS